MISLNPKVSPPTLESTLLPLFLVLMDLSFYHRFQEVGYRPLVLPSAPTPKWQSVDSAEVGTRLIRPRSQWEEPPWAPGVR